MAESLDLLAELTPPESAVAPAATPRTIRLLPPLREEASRILDGQRAIAERLAASNDPKQWFARVYAYVTEEMIAACDRGVLDRPDWVLTLIPRFDAFYTRNLDAYERGEECEPMWQRAWSTCERRDERRPHRPVMAGLMSGVAAHIDADLPRAIAQVHRDRFADCDLREFLPDYLRLAPVFTAASDRLLGDLPRSHTPWWTGVAARVHPQVRDALIARRGYDVARHRMAAFASAVADSCDGRAAEPR